MFKVPSVCYNEFVFKYIVTITYHQSTLRRKYNEQKIKTFYVPCFSYDNDVWKYVMLRGGK